MKRFVVDLSFVLGFALAFAACFTTIDFTVISREYVSRHTGPGSWRLTCNVGTGPSTVTTLVEVTGTDDVTNRVTGRLGLGDLNAARREAIAQARARGDAFSGWFNLRCESEGGLGPWTRSSRPPYLQYRPTEGFYLTMQVYDGGDGNPSRQLHRCLSALLQREPPLQPSGRVADTNR